MIINLLTFGTAALLGHPITAASGFASVALLNQLIAPLNAFPWILNGLVEAYISLKRVQSYLDVSVFSDSQIGSHQLLSISILFVYIVTRYRFTQILLTDETRDSN